MATVTYRKHWLLIAAMVCAAGTVTAAEGQVTLQHAGTNIRDSASLQRGARSFMSYCSGCHSLMYLRYNRMAQDLKIPEKEVTANLMFTSTRIVDGITTAMPAEAADWFGKQPPDLSLIARARGVDYLYSFLKGFYVDSERPWGVNNLYLPNASMPDVLAHLQGLQKPVFHNGPGANDSDPVAVERLTAGALSPEQYDGFVRDITNFLDYAGEPIKAKRESLGVFVMLYLLVGFGLAYLVKKEYWKDVH